MAEISIVQQHNLSPDAARSAAEEVANKIAEEYGLTCQWEGDVLRFGRDGVEGALTLAAQQASMKINLGLFMGVFAPAIQTKVADKMRRTFAAA